MSSFLFHTFFTLLFFIVLFYIVVIFSQLLGEESHYLKSFFHKNHKETIPKSYPIFQQKRKEIAQHVSFVVVLSIIFCCLFLDLWIKPPHVMVQSVSIWDSLLGLFGFMVFVWAVAIMILVGVPFIRVQSVVLVFWAILMHLKLE